MDEHIPHIKNMTNQTIPESLKNQPGSIHQSGRLQYIERTSIEIFFFLSTIYMMAVGCSEIPNKRLLYIKRTSNANFIFDSMIYEIAF